MNTFGKRTRKEQAAFDKHQAERLDVAYECFDYIMNSEVTYRELGTAVGFFERARKRDRRTVEQEMSNPHGKGGPHPWSMTGLRKSFRLTSDIIGKARQDYMKYFKGELEDGGPTWLVDVDLRLVLSIALKYQDRWAT